MVFPIRLLAAMVALVSATGILAQGTPSETSTDEDETAVLQPITVTGYHVKRIDIEGPAPVVVFEREDFERAGVNTLQEFARYLPINLPEFTKWWEAGPAHFDLRGIGIDNTLVLVNGLRIAPYAMAGESVIDVNAIPMSAIERVEILKDGASAIYGADAVAGVVNVILRKGFDGIEVSAGYGTSEEGDGQELLADIVTGWDNGRGSILFSLSWYDREPQWARDREWSEDVDYSNVGGPNFRSSRSSPPTMLRWDNFQWEADSACGTDPLLTNVDASPWGASWGTACWFNYNQYMMLFGGLERLGATLSGRYQINADLSFFGDVLYSDYEGDFAQATAPVHGSALIETYTFLPYVPADHPNNPFGTEGEIRARPLDIGNRIYVIDSSSYRIVAGVEGVWGEWDWVTSGMFSQNDVTKNYHNALPQTRFQLALNGQGGPNGDLWYNPFGFMPENDPGLIDWLTVYTWSEDTSRESSLDLQFSRLFGSLPGGPVGVAIGTQYREQELQQWADEHLLSRDLAGGSFHKPVSADREIFSVYAEFSLPILDSLEAQLAVRWEDYSDFGSTTNPKIALRWQPLPSLMFRGSYSESFRPPSFWELYNPEQLSFGGYEDTVRCEYTGAPEDCERREYRRVASGNPDLQPEEGESWFAGLVWEPDFLPGFELQLDFWEFHHTDRVEWSDAQLILDEGGDFGIIREPSEPDGTPGRIVLIHEAPINTDVMNTRGFDTTLLYGWQTERNGDFNASLMHAYIDEWVLQDTIYVDEQGFNYAGNYRWVNAIPRNRANLNFNWTLGKHGASANIHYVGHYNNDFNTYVGGEETDEPWEIGSHTTFDLQYSYTFDSLKSAVLRIGCHNCADSDPPLTFYVPPEPFHDGRGRFWYFRWQQPIP
jgi:outer membrane receptor protein involved in Fe transport